MMHDTHLALPLGCLTIPLSLPRPSENSENVLHWVLARHLWLTLTHRLPQAPCSTLGLSDISSSAPAQAEYNFENVLHWVPARHLWLPLTYLLPRDIPVRATTSISVREGSTKLGYVATR